MINLIETPQRSDLMAEYKITCDTVTVKISGATEIFDFGGFPDGIADEINVENLPVNPIVSAIKSNGIIDVTVIRFYGADEKGVFENG